MLDIRYGNIIFVYILYVSELKNILINSDKFHTFDIYCWKLSI